MPQNIRLARIPEKQYADYRYEVIFKAYKWDPQVEDSNTVSEYVLLLGRETAAQLAEMAEKLSAETVLMEQVLLERPHLVRELGLPKSVQKALRSIKPPGESHVRLMRFDFHPTTDGWAISEVNSDVPGGLAEASVLPLIAGRFFPEHETKYNIADSLLSAFSTKMKAGGRIAFVHATAYSDDRQVMQSISDHFSRSGYETMFAAPDLLGWTAGHTAISLLEGHEGELDALMRFYPLEWLDTLPRSVNWKAFYTTRTPSCNHPAAILTQSKRLPLIWDRLGVDIPMWKKLLPCTKDPKQIDIRDGKWIMKPALGRVGEDITVKGTMPEKKRKKIMRAAKWHPKDWVAQELFESCALPAEGSDAFHACIGVFTVDGKCAGFYARINPYPRIDSKAKDIPVLIAKARGQDERKSGSI